MTLFAHLDYTISQINFYVWCGVKFEFHVIPYGYFNFLCGKYIPQGFVLVSLEMQCVHRCESVAELSIIPLIYYYKTK